MKTLFKVVAGLAVVLLIVIVVGVFNLDKGIKAVVETVGPELTKSSVTLSDVDLSLTSGKGSLRGLVVGNPAGFSSSKAFSLGEISIAVDPASVTTDTITINSIRIVAPEITYESLKGGTNLDQLQKNVEQAIGASNNDAATEAKGGGEDAVAKKLIIRDLTITGGKISYSNALLGSKSISLPLPPLHLTGIGEKSGGASAGEVVGQVLGAINKSAASAVTRSGALKDTAEQVKKSVKEKLGGWTATFKKD
jgi:uncharacterized protein involved in outer membrane biogenesis